MCEEEGGIWPEVRLRKATKSRVKVLPDHNMEGNVVVLQRQEAKVESVKHGEGTWQDDVAAGSSE